MVCRKEISQLSKMCNSHTNGIGMIEGAVLAARKV